MAFLTSDWNVKMPPINSNNQNINKNPDENTPLLLS
jgi:hypothetical protein